MEGALRAPGLMADIVQVLVAVTFKAVHLGWKSQLMGGKNCKEHWRLENIEILYLQTGQLGLEQRGRSGSLHQVA